MSHLHHRSRVKAIRQEGETMESVSAKGVSVRWAGARRGSLCVYDDSLECGDWKIPYSEIADAEVLSVPYFLTSAYLLRVETGSAVYQFGLSPDKFWRGTLPLEVSRGRAKGTGFVFGQIIRFAVLIWLQIFPPVGLPYLAYIVWLHIRGGTIPAAGPEYAGFCARAGAWLIDYAAALVLYYTCWGLTMLVCKAIFHGRSEVALLWDSETMADFIGAAGCITLFWLYCAVFESSSAQGTPGKLALGIRVTDLSGERITFGRATVRFFCKIILSSPFFGAGFLVAVFTEKRQCLHDLIARCLVLKRHLP